MDIVVYFVSFVNSLLARSPADEAPAEDLSDFRELWLSADEPLQAVPVTEEAPERPTKRRRRSRRIARRGEDVIAK